MTDWPPWGSDPASPSAMALTGLYFGIDPGPEMVAELIKAGMLGADQRLTNRGRTLAYHFAEAQEVRGQSQFISALLIGCEAQPPIVDIGGASGHMLRQVLRSTLQPAIVIDRSLSPLSLGQHLTAALGQDVSFVHGDGHALPLAPGSTGTVISRLTFMHMRERQAWAEVARVLGPNGHALLICTGWRFHVEAALRARSLRDLAARTFSLCNGLLVAITSHTAEIAGRADHFQTLRSQIALARKFGFTLVAQGPIDHQPGRGRGFYLLVRGPDGTR